MLEFRKAFGIDDGLLPGLPDATEWGDGDGSDESRTELLSHWLFENENAKALRLRIVGQELGFVLLFAWDGYEEADTERKHRKTFIERVQLENQERTLLYTHTDTMEVVAATVNHECTLLGFTTITQYKASDKSAYEGIYESYLVEVQSQRPMLFNFNTPRPSHQRLQFLYSESASLSHLLLFRHKESIDVYAIHTGPGHQGIEIIDPAPHSEEIVGRFIWSQFDLSRQSVYFLYLRPSQHNSLGYDTMLKCVQFTSKNRYDVKMDIMLPLETLWAGFADFQTEYVCAPCSHSLLFTPFNMEVVHMDGGGICVCFQHAPTTAGNSRNDNEAEPSISFSVFVLHHCCTLEYTIPLPGLEHSILPSVRVYFSALNGFLLAFIPGHAMQLIDCGAHHEPCHHLVFLGDEVPVLPGYESPTSAITTTSPPSAPSNSTSTKKKQKQQQTNQKQSQEEKQVATSPPMVTYFELVKQENGRNAYGVAMFDVTQGTAYTYFISPELVFDLFASGKASLTNQIMTLHMVVVHLANAALMRRILEYFFAGDYNKLHLRLIKEYVIGNSYMSMEQHSQEARFLRLLPLTSINTYYEELHGGAAGNDFSQNCPVSYIYARLDQLALQDGTRGKAIQGDMYDSLFIQKGEQDVSRFSFESVHDRLNFRVDQSSEREQQRLARKESGVASPLKGDPTDSLKRGLSFFKRRGFFSLGSTKTTEIRPTHTSSHGSLSTSSQLGGSGSYADLNSDFADREEVTSPNAPPDEEARVLQKRVLHTLHLHLRRFCPDMSAEQCLDWANDYHNCQFLQSTEIFRSMISVRTSPETVAACIASVSRYMSGELRLTKSAIKAAMEGSAGAVDALAWHGDELGSPVMMSPDVTLTESENERILFRLMEKLYYVIQETSFPFPQGFHHRFVSLAYRSLTRPLFKQYLANRVLRVTEEFVMRTLSELMDYDTQEDNRFKFFLLSFLDPHALARAHKEWQHMESQRYLSHMTVSALLAAQDDDHANSRGQHIPPNETDDDEELGGPGDTGYTPSFPPLRAFMRALQQKERSATKIPGSSASRVRLSFVEDCALLSSSGGNVEDNLDVSF
eukprot:m.229604 g.229604  ORF g.229604 m.229604 type:complete len:1082 (+) comp15990_c1_seq2:1274-4519(+)